MHQKLSPAVIVYLSGSPLLITADMEPGRRDRQIKRAAVTQSSVEMQRPGSTDLSDLNCINNFPSGYLDLIIWKTP
jgi:hypothetical protein